MIHYQLSRFIPDFPTLRLINYISVRAAAAAVTALLLSFLIGRPIITRLHGELVKIIKSPESVARLAGVGAIPVANTPEQFAEANRRDVAKWGKIIRDNGIKAD